MIEKGDICGLDHWCCARIFTPNLYIRELKLKIKITFVYLCRTTWSPSESMTAIHSGTQPVWAHDTIVQLEAIKNVDKIISNSIYILKDNLAFTTTGYGY